MPFKPEQSSHYNFTTNPQTRRMKLTKTQRKLMKGLAKSKGRTNPREEAMERGAGKILGLINSPYLEPCLNVKEGEYTYHFNKFAETYHFSHKDNTTHASASDDAVSAGLGLKMPWPQMLQHIKEGTVTKRYS